MNRYLRRFPEVTEYLRGSPLWQRGVRGDFPAGVARSYGKISPGLPFSRREGGVCNGEILTGNRLRIIAVLGVLGLLAGCAERDMSDLRNFVETTKRTTPIRKPEPTPKIEPYQPFTYTAQGLKDPFLVSPFAEPVEPGVIRDGVRLTAAPEAGCIAPDPNRIREELEKYSLGSLKMMGTVRMGGTDELWALILAPDNVVHRVQKNNYLGANHGKIINISEQRVDLKEIVPDRPGCWQERESFLSLTQ